MQSVMPATNASGRRRAATAARGRAARSRGRSGRSRPRSDRSAWPRIAAPTAEAPAPADHRGGGLDPAALARNPPARSGRRPRRVRPAVVGPVAVHDRGAVEIEQVVALPHRVGRPAEQAVASGRRPPRGPTSCAPTSSWATLNVREISRSVIPGGSGPASPRTPARRIALAPHPAQLPRRLAQPPPPRPAPTRRRCRPVARHEPGELADRRPDGASRPSTPTRSRRALDHLREHLRRVRCELDARPAAPALGGSSPT